LALMCCKTDKIERFGVLTARSLSLRPARLCRSSPSRSILDPAEFTLSEAEGLEMTEFAVGMEASVTPATNRGGRSARSSGL